jgi:hypothetical protein
MEAHAGGTGIDDFHFPDSDTHSEGDQADNVQLESDHSEPSTDESNGNEPALTPEQQNKYVHLMKAVFVM